jgi:uncharacterized delta-60 repeat protein
MKITRKYSMGFAVSALVPAFSCAALSILFQISGELALLAQSSPFQLASTNTGPTVLPGRSVWLDTNATVTAVGPVNWAGGSLQVDLATNSDPIADGFEISPVVTNLQVQANQLLYNGVPIGTVVEQVWHPSWYLGRLNTNGGLDNSFSVPADLEVSSLAIQPDGKILIAGAFHTLAGQPRANIARLNPNGTLDSAFNPSVSNPDGTYSEVSTLAIQHDGKILVGGYFSELNGQPRSNLGRLNPDGSLDTIFNPGVIRGLTNYAEVDCFLEVANGRILVGGLFDALAGQSRKNFARLNSDGTLDTSFNPEAIGYRVTALALQDNGQVLVGGAFDTLAGVPRLNLGRLNADDTLDVNFAPDPDQEVDSLAFLAGLSGSQPILLGGAFSNLAGQARVDVGRLNPDGSLYANFNAGLGKATDNKVAAIAAQPDGKILLGGQFSSVGAQERDCLARLNADLSLDTNFNSGAHWIQTQGNVSARINALAVQGDGKIVVGGYFNALGPARLRIEFNSAATTEAVDAVIRALVFTNLLEPQTLDALVDQKPPVGLRVSLSDGNGHLEAVDKSVTFLYLVDVEFDPPGVYVTGTVDGQTVLRCALNNAPGAWTTLNGYSTAVPFSDCGSDFNPATQTLSIPTCGSPDSTCDGSLQIGPLTAPLNVHCLAEDACAVDLFEEITYFEPHALHRRALKQPDDTSLVSAANFRALEGLMNQTAEGQRLAGLYRQHTAELVNIMLTNQPLLLDTLKLVQDFQPGVASLLAGDGSSFVISPGMVSQVQVLASQFANLGSTNLRASIQAEKTRLNNFTGFTGQDFNHWAGALGVSIPTNAFVDASQPHQTNGQFSVQANGLDGFNYSLWRTPDLTGSPWQLLTNTLVVRNGFTLELTDPTPLPARAFYRIATRPVPPVLVNQPPAVNVLEGANAFISVAASGFHLAYQWQLNGVDIPGATNATLTLAHVTRCQAGLYTANISNGGGTVASAPAWLEVAAQSFTLLTNGLLAHFPFDVDYHDASGNGYDGRPVGAPVLTTGEVGSGGLRFTTLQNGSSFNFVSLATNLVKQIATNDFSLAFWINLTNTGVDVALMGNTDVRSATNAGLGLVAGRFGYLVLSVIDRAGESAFAQCQLTLDGAWHHVAITCQRRGLAEIYVDGVPTGAASLASVAGSIDSGLPLNVGQDGTGAFLGTGATGIGSGVLDDLGIWQRALTGTEVASLYFEGSEGLTFDSLPTRPAIFAQPCSQVVTEGMNADFSVIALGDKLSYQWQWNGSNLPAATSDSLILSNTQLSQAGAYTVVVSNVFGSVTSNPAMLTVNTRPAYVLTNGLIAHLPFDESYNDISGSGFNGLPVGGPGLSTGKVGSGALRLSTAQDGSNFNYVTLGTNVAAHIATNDFSIAFWINVANFAGNPPLLGNKDWANALGTGLVFAVGADGNLLADVGIGIGSPLNVSGARIADGTWHHVAMTYQRGRLSVLYLDGEIITTTDLVLSGTINSGLPLNIGQDGTGKYFGSGTAGITNALLDDVGIWRRALEQREVEFIYLQGRDGLTFDSPR